MDNQPKPYLTPNEMEIAQDLANGYSLAYIARRMGKAVPTINIQSRFVKLKLRARSLGEVGTKMVLYGLYEYRSYESDNRDAEPDTGEVSDACDS